MKIAVLFALAIAALGDQQNPQPSDITYYLYTRSNQNNPEFISYNDAVINPLFDAGRKTVAIAHGFSEDVPNSPWMPHMKDLILQKEDANVILMDWGILSKDPRYDLAAPNAIYAGSDLALLLQDLSSRAGLRASNVHLIGFSLGAQVVGVAGNRFRTVARISGLDPAKPLFDSNPLSDRLDESDADFVDVIHTNSGILVTGHLSFMEVCGHVDFYPNGGHDQRGCPPLLAEVGGSLADLTLDEIDACSHGRAPAYYLTSLQRSDFLGYACADYETYQTGGCTSNTNVMGWDVDSSNLGTFFMETLVDSPFVASQIRTDFDIGTTTEGSLVLRNIIPGYSQDNFTIFSGRGGVNAGDKLTTIITASSGGVTAEDIVLLYDMSSGGSSSLMVTAINGQDLQSGEQTCIGSNLDLPSGIEVGTAPTSGSC